VPISMPIVAMVAIDLLDVAVLRFPASLAGWAGALPDHSISGNFGAVTGDLKVKVTNAGRKVLEG
jgi:hypothetical protein